MKIIVGVCFILLALYLHYTINDMVYKKSKKPVYDGRIIITKDEMDITRYSLLLDEDLDTLEHKKTITFVVTRGEAVVE